MYARLTQYIVCRTYHTCFGGYQIHFGRFRRKMKMLYYNGKNSQNETSNKDPKDNDRWSEI
jgi:hypothetical protein